MTTAKKMPAPRCEAGVTSGKHLQQNFYNCTNSGMEINQHLPHDQDAEIGLIRACLSDPEAVDRARQFIDSEDFYRTGSQIVFKMLCVFRDSGRGFTPSQITNAFQGSKNSDQVENFILDLAPFFTGQTSRFFSHIVLEQSLRRFLICAVHKSNSDCFNQEVSVCEILTALESAITRIRGRMTHG